MSRGLNTSVHGNFNQQPLNTQNDYSIPIVQVCLGYSTCIGIKIGLSMCVLNLIMLLSLKALKQKQNQSDITN